MGAGPLAAVPLVLHPAGQPILCVGAGPVAAAKVSPFVEAGAVVTVVAPAAGEEVARAAAAGRLRFHRRSYHPDDVRGAVLVIAATDQAAVNAAVAHDAAAVPVLCVRVDGAGSAALAAAVRRDPLLIAVSTGGAAPALARRIRRELGERYGAGYGELARLLGELRTAPEVAALLADLPAADRAARWRSILDTDILALVEAGRLHRAREVALACLSSPSG